MSFTPFDPLEFKSAKVTDAALGALKREIENILSSYVGWYDPFCELIQNALDAVEAREAVEKAAGTHSSYKPKIDIDINLDENSLTVIDNGIGLDKERFEQFLAPNFSFKSGNTRGHKGVGATYVAYGFNYMKISTKVPGFEASGRIVGALNWIKSKTQGANPKVEPDDAKHVNDAFDVNDRGVSITVRFDENTHPKQLDWNKADTADKWKKILSIKTGLGSIFPNESILININVHSNSKVTSISTLGTSYYWLYKSAAKKATVRELDKESKVIFEKYGGQRKMPDKYRNLDFIYETWSSAELETMLSGALDADEKEIIKKHSPIVSMEFGHTAKVWNIFNESLSLRSGYKVLTSGIQLAANNMPQGETI